MSPEPPFTLVDPERAREAAERLFATVRRELEQMLGPGADIRHIGATAVPGCLTKGDLDIVVRVPAGAFATADSRLAERFPRNTGSIRTDAFSGFEDAASRPPLGVQLVAIGGPFDDFHHFISALEASPALVADYNALKLAHDGAEMAVYRAAKVAFVERVLAGRSHTRSDDDA